MKFRHLPKKFIHFLHALCPVGTKIVSLSPPNRILHFYLKLAFSYDVQNRLTGVTDTQSALPETTFVYDGDAGRVKKIVDDGQQAVDTAYVGSLFEKDSNGTFRDHVFAGSMKVCTFEVIGEDVHIYHRYLLPNTRPLAQPSYTQAPTTPSIRSPARSLMAQRTCISTEHGTTTTSLAGSSHLTP